MAWFIVARAPRGAPRPAGHRDGGPHIERGLARRPARLRQRGRHTTTRAIRYAPRIAIGSHTGLYYMGDRDLCEGLRITISQLI